MPVSNTPIVERVARILAAQHIRKHLEDPEESSIGRQVDESWPQYTDNALEILKTLREPDASMAQAGNLVNWQSMIGAAINGGAACKTKH